MTVLIDTEASKVTPDQLVNVYRKFCEAYGTEFGVRDERFLRTLGIEALHHGYLDYRPFMGGKFFGQRSGAQTQFHGYTDPDANEQRKDKVFQRLVHDLEVK